jgi:peptide/nickel transport system substrate-binding protein
MKRRSFLKGAAAGGVLSACAFGAPAIAQAPRVLKYIPQANLTSLDPIWTTATVTTLHGYHIYDVLYGVDAQFRPKPQMAEGHTVSDDNRTWTIRLRPGLKFHDGEPVRAQDCVPSIRRWAARDSAAQIMMRSVEAITAVDDRTIQIKLRRPFPPLLDVLAKGQANVCFIMPERIARTDPMQQVTEFVGSGPFRFVRDEFVSGSRVVYTRFADYVPRQEAAENMAGGKVVHFDRAEWLVIPDPATAAAAIQAGEVDWLERPTFDLLPVLRRNRNIELVNVNTTGEYAMMRFNQLHPPFNNVAIRRAVMQAVDQEDYLRAVIGDDTSIWRTCTSWFPCGTPYGTEIAGNPLTGARNVDAAKAALRAAGYNNEKVVVVSPTDQPTLHPLGQVTEALLRRLGMNVEFIATDWGTVVQRRAMREPGAWNIFHTTWSGISLINPLFNPTLRGNGAGAWFGWPDDQRIEDLHTAWVEAPTPEAQARVALEIQQRAFETVPLVPLGMWTLPQAVRRTLTGMVKGIVAVPWNVRRV